MIRVLLAEDHTIVRKGLRALLDKEHDISVIGEAADGLDTVRIAMELEPDIILMDISMPKLNGLEATRQISSGTPSVKILILSMHTDESYVTSILHAGAAGYIVKQAAHEELVTAIRAVYDGRIFLSPWVARGVVDRLPSMDGTGDAQGILSSRERQVLQLIAEGCSTRETADALCISPKTVETHRSHIMEKLGITSVAGLTRYAIKKGISSLE